MDDDRDDSRGPRPFHTHPHLILGHTHLHGELPHHHVPERGCTGRCHSTFGGVHYHPCPRASAPAPVGSW